MSPATTLPPERPELSAYTERMERARRRGDDAVLDELIIVQGETTLTLLEAVEAARNRDRVVRGGLRALEERVSAEARTHTEHHGHLAEGLLALSADLRTVKSDMDGLHLRVAGELAGLRQHDSKHDDSEMETAAELVRAQTRIGQLEAANLLQSAALSRLVTTKNAGIFGGGLFSALALVEGLPRLLPLLARLRPLLSGLLPGGVP